jgi:predicted ArsR family transcriptional regulator
MDPTGTAIAPHLREFRPARCRSRVCNGPSIGAMPKPTFAERIEAIASLREPIRRRLYRYVERQTVAVSRDEAAEAVGTSRAMAAFHLDKLVELGLLRAEYRRLGGRTGRGAGRPSKLYRRSRRQFTLTFPERNHELLARLLAEEAAHHDASSTDAPAGRYGRSLGARARKRISNGAAQPRLRQCVEDVLEDLGFEPFRSDTGDTRARNCPFDPLSRSYSAVVCRAAIALVGGVIEGSGANSVEARRDARVDRCCVVLSPRSPSDGDAASAS